MDKLDLNNIGVNTNISIITKRGEQIDGTVALITEEYAELLITKNGKKYIARVLHEEMAIVVIPDESVVAKEVQNELG